MAKIVIAGASNCPYFAKIELLADSLAENLDHFNIHKIIKQPSEWEAWLKDTCVQRGWKHNKSPIVWRELIDRGGKGTLIGGANDFQEYAHGYYDVKSDFISEDMTKIAEENTKTKIEMDEEDKYYKSLSNPVNVCITNAASGVAYGMIHAIAKGDCLGSETEISLHLYDSADKLNTLAGVEMEAFDLACPLLRRITVTSDPKVAFKDCVAIVLLDEIEQGEEESRNDWLKRNSDYFVNYAKIINEVANKDVKVIVGGNGPVNFNTFMMIENSSNVPKENIVALSRMVENNAKAVLSERLHVNSADVVDVIVWGNPNGQYYLDMQKARVHRYDGAIWGPPSFSLPAGEMVADDKWLATEFLDAVTKRKETVETALKHLATCSHAAAVYTLLGHWFNDTPKGQMFSLGVISDGSYYDIPEGVVYSLPVRFCDGKWSVVNDLELSPEQKEQLKQPVEDLMREKYSMYPHLKPPSPIPPTPPPTEEKESTEEKKVFGETEKDPETTDDSTDKSEDPSDAEDKPSLEKIAEDKEGEEQAQIEFQDKPGSETTEQPTEEES